MVAVCHHHADEEIDQRLGALWRTLAAQEAEQPRQVLRQGLVGEGGGDVLQRHALGLMGEGKTHLMEFARVKRAIDDGEPQRGGANAVGQTLGAFLQALHQPRGGVRGAVHAGLRRKRRG